MLTDNEKIAKNKETIDGPGLDLCSAVLGFYILEDIKAVLPNHNKGNIAKRKQIELIEEVRQYQRRFYAPKLAKNLYDYLVLACYAETRYAEEKSDAGLCFAGNLDGSRDRAARECVKYNPARILDIAEGIFSHDWIDGFGGTPWETIAKRAARYNILSNINFVDLVVNSAHNDGLAFDKGYLVELTSSSDTFLKMLDHRSKEGLLENLSNFIKHIPSYIRSMPHDIYDFVVRAECVGLIEQGFSATSTQARLRFAGIDWGMAEPETEDCGAYCNNCWCDHCEDSCRTNDVMSFEGNCYCKHCYNELVFCCNICGGGHWVNEVYSDPDGNHICEDCRCEYFTYCEDCEQLFANDDMQADIEADNAPICRKCWDEKYFICNGHKCYSTFKTADGKKLAGCLYCEKCFNEHSKQSSFRFYSEICTKISDHTFLA